MARGLCVEDAVTEVLHALIEHGGFLGHGLELGDDGRSLGGIQGLLVLELMVERRPEVLRDRLVILCPLRATSLSSPSKALFSPLIQYSWIINSKGDG